MGKNKIQKTTEAARTNLADQQAAGTHNPAKPCGTCGVWRTPGLTHTPPGKSTPTCTG